MPQGCICDFNVEESYLPESTDEANISNVFHEGSSQLGIIHNYEKGYLSPVLTSV